MVDMANMDQVRALGWWTISGECLMDMMRRAHAGEDPEMVYAEEYANAEIDRRHLDGDDER